MHNNKPSTHALPAAGGHTVPVYVWTPDGAPKAVIQLFHGLGEHVARYERFAHAATVKGYIVVAHNHRGHGPESKTIGVFGPAEGWQLLLDDGRQVFEFLKQRYPSLPVVLLGHSMGSFLAQNYAMRYAGELAALVLSGSAWPARGQVIPGRFIARVISWFRGREKSSAFLDKTGFGDFNKRFEPARTELDWLSRDPQEVDRYVADPLCGGPYSIGLWLDLLGGLLAVSTDAALRTIPGELPILITGGGDDPVGGDESMQALTAHYEATAHTNVTAKIYAGGRHEMLNETNRDEFTNDVLAWIDRRIDSYQP